MMTNSAAVATAHPAAADAAAGMLRSGGNAVDAAVAAMLALCVVQPPSVGLGGYGGSMVAHLAREGRTVVIDFDSRAPRAYQDELFADDHRARSFGPLAVTVPGVIAGLGLASESYGVKPWREACRWAVALAGQGFEVDEDLHRHLLEWAGRADARSARALCPSGIPCAGSTFVQPDLAKLIQTLADDGPRAMYEGEIPRAIVRELRESGGILAEDDFRAYRAAEARPVSVKYRGHDLYTPPPPSGGITSLAILRTLEQFDLAAVEPWGAAYLHLVAESGKRCWQERVRHLGDPDVIEVPIDEMLSAAAAAHRAAEIRAGAGAGRDATHILDTGPHTANVVTADAEGNVVSVTATQGWLFGSQVVIEGLGLVMGHGMSRFDYDAASPNRPAPGKRMHHNMSPLIALRDGRPRFAVGMPGGPKIVSVTAQLCVDLIDFNCSAAAAVAAPRVHAELREPVAVSLGLSPEIVAALGRLGHTVVRGQDVGGKPDEIGGPPNVITMAATGRKDAASAAGPGCALSW